MQRIIQVYYICTYLISRNVLSLSMEQPHLNHNIHDPHNIRGHIF